MTKIPEGYSKFSYVPINTYFLDHNCNVWKKTTEDLAVAEEQFDGNTIVQLVPDVNTRRNMNDIYKDLKCLMVELDRTIEHYEFNFGSVNLATSVGDPLIHTLLKTYRDYKESECKLDVL